MEEGNSHRVFDPLMEKEVEEEAIRRVASILSTTDALPRASQHRLQLLRKREILTSKISSMVQNSLSETEFALQTVKSNLDRSNSVQDKFQELVAHCLDCQNILNAKEYPFIKAIRFARKNLESTIRLFTLFQEIPQTAEALVAALESGEINLKDAYLEIRRLYRIRERARVQGEKYAEKFLQLFEKQFESVRVAIKTLEYLLLQDIEKAIDLSGDDPVRLVSSLQVVEMEDRAKKYKIFQEANPHLSAQRHQSMREKVFDRMEKSIAEFFAKMFQDSVTSMEYKREGQESDKTLAEVLKIGNKVLGDLQFIHQFTVPCFPQDYKILEFFEARYTKFFSSRLLNVTADTSSLSPAALLECLKWVDDYTSGLKGIGIEESQVGILNSIRKIMMETYLEREKVKIETWFKSILKNDWSSSPKQVDGIYITSAPQDLFSLLGTLIEGACSRLNGKAFVNVVKMCCSAVSNYQNQLLNKISSHGAEKDEDYVCALINNSNLCQENTSIIQEKTSSHVLQLTDSSAEELVIELEEIFDSIIDGFVRIGNCSVDLLVSKIIETLQVSLFDSLFTNSWLTDSECTTMQSVAVTLHDYFEDYLCGISAQFYLSSLFKHTLRRLIRLYCEAFVNSKPNILEDGLFSRVDSDMKVLEECLMNEKYREFITRKYITDQLEYISKLKTLFESEEGFISLYFDAIHYLFESNGLRFLQTILLTHPEISSAKVRVEILADYQNKYPDESAQEKFSYSSSFGPLSVITNMRLPELSSLNQSKDSHGKSL